MFTYYQHWPSTDCMVKNARFRTDVRANASQHREILRDRLGKHLDGFRVFEHLGGLALHRMNGLLECYRRLCAFAPAVSNELCEVSSPQSLVSVPCMHSLSRSLLHTPVNTWRAFTAVCTNARGCE